MRRLFLLIPFALTIPAMLLLGQNGPYKVLKIVKVGGDGGFDYVYADEAGRKLYVPRMGQAGKITVFDLDSIAPAGEITGSGHGAAVDPKSGHGFASSKPVVMWDTKTLQPIKTIDVQGGPDGISFDPFNAHVYIWSHSAPNATVINAADGAVLGTIDLGGAPEQAASDGKGHIYVDVEDKANVAVIDAKTMAVTAHYPLGDKGSTPAGLALDAKNGVLFVACRQPAPGTMVMMSTADGKILATLPLAGGSDGAVFNPKTMEAFSSTSNTLTIIKETSPTTFEVEQNLPTMPMAKTLTLDAKTDHVLLIGAEQTPPPPPQPGAAPGRGGRGQMVPGSFSVVVVGK